MVILMQYKEQIMVDEIRRIMSEITGRDFSNINENISLFSSAIGTKARDILCLFLEIESSPNLCVNSSSSYISPSMLPLSSGDLIEWSLVCHSILSYQKFCD